MSSSSEGQAAPVREFGYTRRDFERVKGMIRERAGIALADSKQDMVYSRLSRRLRELSLRSVGQYLDRLAGNALDGEWTEFTNALTTNLTAFFRENHHFEILRDHLATLPPGKPVKIWCSAASTGEEPWSLAMTVAEHYGLMAPNVAILATDLDTNVLATAERGVYPLERVAKLSEARLRKFFRRGTGAHEGQCRIVDALRPIVHFRQLNLLDERWPIRGGLDAIFCRNVMIYFDKPTQYRILKKFVPLLNPDGLLFAGHSESFLHAADLFKPCGRTVYRLAGGADE